ncbi:MAG: glycoside hydrolase family 97 N-terminal domain-containing protein, partial [Muribaculaceae bacterium]|nr:glycoside hydrolase family 97 N-terminal domain-containing protein [Muribaculaceae bacterium]
MKKISAILLMIAVALNMAAVSITSPDGNLVLHVELTPQGAPYYTLDYKNKPVVTASALGLKSEQLDLTDGFRIASTDTMSVDRTWEPVWGEYSTIRDNFNEMAVNLIDKDHQREFTIRFRLFNDGLGFRYELPVQKGPNHLTLKDEVTEFNFNGDHKLYCIPGDYDTDEYLWSETTFSKLPEALSNYARHSEAQRVNGTTIQTPMLLKTDDGLYINVHEAALDGYPAMLLDVDTENYSMKSHLVPDRLGVSAYLQMPFNTPWRTLIVSDDARDILASQLVLNLNEPCKIEDTSW